MFAFSNRGDLFKCLLSSSYTSAGDYTNLFSACSCFRRDSLLRKVDGILVPHRPPRPYKSHSTVFGTPNEGVDLRKNLRRLKSRDWPTSEPAKCEKPPWIRWKTFDSEQGHKNLSFQPLFVKEGGYLFDRSRQQMYSPFDYLSPAQSGDIVLSTVRGRLECFLWRHRGPLPTGGSSMGEVCRLEVRKNESLWIGIRPSTSVFPHPRSSS